MNVGSPFQVLVPGLRRVSSRPSAPVVLSPPQAAWQAGGGSASPSPGLAGRADDEDEAAHRPLSLAELPMEVDV